MSSLYGEAIADAKKIRELAEENAKKAVLEAVTPKIREFIENQILEQDPDDSKQESSCDKHEEKEDKEDKEVKEKDDSEVVLDESAVKALLDLLGENTLDEDFNGRSRDEVNLALQEAVSRLSGSERSKLFSIAEEKNSPIAENLNSRDLDMKKEKNMSREKFYEIDLESLRESVAGGSIFEAEHEGDDDADAPEVDLDAGEETFDIDAVEQTVKELIDQLGLDIEGGDADLDLDLPADDVDLDDDDEDDGLDLGVAGGEDDEVLEEVYDVDPRILRQELRRMSQELRENAGLAGEKGGISKDMEHHFGGKGKGNAGIDGAFGGGKAGKDVLSEMRSVLRKQKHQNDALSQKLTKYRSAVRTLREQLEELNLFNAKLLYVNKLLQNKSINESQKRSIVKALDAAQDLREAKVLYSSLTESFKQGSAKKANLNESVRKGSSSRTTKSASSAMASNEVNRWAKLAGLK